ncbi:MAG: phycobiliprotein lyase [Cyanobacteria bacterium SBLK]|nr:phycobiliprotein lyase [Cyanobacteria bacterium SBLK]
MSSLLLKSEIALGELAIAFLQESVGDWHSQRRYYSLETNDVQEVESFLTVRFLSRGTPELEHLAALHGLEDASILRCGSQVTWESSYIKPSRKPLSGSIVFGMSETLVYRDRGFATLQPITAQYHFPENSPKILHLRTEYNSSVFEEEFKFIGANYRTRQTIISRAGKEQTIGQYLEKRI